MDKIGETAFIKIDTNELVTIIEVDGGIIRLNSKVKMAKEKRLKRRKPKLDSFTLKIFITVNSNIR